jgi:hypothetical protein
MDTGHEKNVKNFETVIIILVSLGAIYTPAQALILLPALQAKLAEAQAAIAAVNAAEADKTVKTDELQGGFLDYDNYITNVKRTAEVVINDDAFTRDLQNLVNRARPQSRKTGLPDDPSTPDIDESRTAHSTSMRSYDSQIAFLSDVAALIRTKADAYKPNDAEYTLEAIDAKIASLTTNLNAARTAEAILGNARDTRDRILYDDQTGILKLVKLIKTQLALKPGKNSAAYQQVNALEFRKP